MTRPNIQIPKEFAINGEKADFTQEKMQTGFDKLNPDIFAGDNINKFIDDTYKGLNGVLDLYNGVVLHEMTTTYDDKAVVGKFIENSFKLYRSLVNDNTGHEVTETEYWEEVALGGGSGFNLFDTKVSDHVLEGNEALGWALQGTYVYKEGIAGSRTGYADFYNKCLAEKEQGTATVTTLGDNTITMHVNANGHKFYDVADKAVVDTWYDTYGIADYYGVDETNERIFLPRDKYFALTGGVMGNGMALGLTDGTNNFGIGSNDTVSSYIYTYNNAYGEQVNNSPQNTGSGNQGYYGITTDSTKSGITLEPNENKYLYICVGNTKVESAISNVTEITTSENDTLPLFYNFYSKEDMTTTGAYVNASLGSWLSGNVYTTAYNELVNKLGTGNVKANTDTYTDYDFVVNQDEMSFRLPLKNGQEVMFATGVKGNGKTLGLTDGTTTNNFGLANSANDSYGLYGTTSVYGTNVGASASGGTQILGQHSVGITTDSTKSGIILDTENITIPDGWNLYYKVANAVTNLELLDVAKVTNDLNTCYKRNAGDNSDLSGLSMPSNRYIDLTLGASGTSYTAPANGYFFANKVTNGANQQISFINSNNNFGNRCFVSLASTAAYTYIPAKKGDVISCTYTAGGAISFFRFYYAEGEV